MSASHSCVSYSIDTLPDEIFYFTLCEHHRDMLSLCSHWSNPLASISQFDSQIREASALAESLSGDHPCISLFWLNPTTVEAPKESPEEENVNLNSITSSQEAPCEPEHAVLADFLADDHGCHEDAIEDQPTVTATIIWEPPEMRVILPYFQIKSNPERVAGHDLSTAAKPASGHAQQGGLETMM